MGFPGGASGEEPTCQCRRPGDVGSVPGLGRSPKGGNGNTHQHSYLENPTERGAWRATVHRVTKSQTRLRTQGTWGTNKGIMVSLLNLKSAVLKLPPQDPNIHKIFFKKKHCNSRALRYFCLEIAGTAASQVLRTLLCTVLLSQLKGIK